VHLWALSPHLPVTSNVPNGCHDPTCSLTGDPGIETSLGKAGGTTRPKQCNRSSRRSGWQDCLMERQPSWLGRVATSELRSRHAACTCAGLEAPGAYRAIMICVIIRDLHSGRGGITQAHAIRLAPIA
jgi:hypothetical protein